MTTGISETEKSRATGRIRLRTLVTAGGAAVFGCLLYFQWTRTDPDPASVVLGADPGWMLLATLAAVASYPAATAGFLGFVPERIGFGRAALAQVAGSFVKLVAPMGLGGVALNTRLLQRAGVTPGQAVSSVGAGQLAGLALHMLQLAFFVSMFGIDPGAGLSSHPTALLVGGATVAVLAAAVLAVPWSRDRLLARLRPLTEGSLSRLRDLLRHPGRLAVGVLGQLLVSMALVVSLYCCVRATGAQPHFSAVAVAFLAGNALGSAVPTPGGLLGVETAIAGMLSQTTGLGTASALATVLLFRLLTFVLPVLPGWASLHWLQRHDAL